MYTQKVKPMVMFSGPPPDFCFCRVQISQNIDGFKQNN